MARPSRPGHAASFSASVAAGAEGERMTRVYRVAAVAMLVVLVPAGLAFGQATTATVRGRVHDSQGRPVPSATVTVTGRDTGLSRIVPAAGDGGFVVANLPPGLVDVAAAASGFATAPPRRRGARGRPDPRGPRHRADRRRRAGDGRRCVAAAVAVDTTRSVVDGVLPASRIEALPLNGRNFLELALLVPGNAPRRSSIRRRRTAC